MNDQAVFTQIDPDLSAEFQEIRSREPIFHTPQFGSTIRDFENSTSTDYWEVGASGRRYSRAFILRELAKTPPVDAAAAGWHARDHGLRRLGPDTFLFTYTLHQGERLTRRATIWQRVPDGWRILYHQGTIVSAPEEERHPS